MENIEHLRSKIHLIECDLRDSTSVRRLLEVAEPTHVVHLAAQSFVGSSWHTPMETFSTNIESQVNLLEGIRKLKVVPRFLEMPIKEMNPLRPLSPYAVSKVAQDMMGFQYFKSWGLPIVRSRASITKGPVAARCS